MSYKLATGKYDNIKAHPDDKYVVELLRWYYSTREVIPTEFIPVPYRPKPRVSKIPKIKKEKAIPQPKPAKQHSSIKRYLSPYKYKDFVRYQ